MTPRQLRQQGEIGPGLLPFRRNAHQAGERQRRGADLGEQARQRVNRDAALLRLGADVDLDMDRGKAARFLGSLDQRLQ